MMNLEESLQTQQTLITKRVDTKELRARLSAGARMLWAADEAPMEASLVFSRDGHGKVEVTPIGRGITVGRSTKCAICLEHQGDLSRKHFSVRPEDGDWVVEDLGSRNGTTLEGMEKPLTAKHLLRDGDFVFAADLMFLFINPKD
jgi:pSer/pThr/pTyr-binding forkhead associated (FHA) protein